MKFILPEYLLLLLALPLFISGAVFYRRGITRRVRLLIGTRPQPSLSHPRNTLRGWAGLTSLIIALLLLIVALASPVAGFREEQETVRARSIMIAIDVSRSMFATDLQPNRFHAAKASALELLDRFPSDRIGIIAFSGKAWVQAPLTLDHEALRSTLQQLDTAARGTTDWIPRDGSDLPSAVRLAVRTLQKHELASTTLIVLSDGENHHMGVSEAASEAAAAKVTVFSVGFGSIEGSMIPDSSTADGNFYDRDGSLVISSLNREPLALLSRVTGGTYSEGAGRRFLFQVENAIERMEFAEFKGSRRRIANPLFQWFLAPSILLFATGMVLNSGYPLSRRNTKQKRTGPPSPNALLVSGLVILSFAFPCKAAPLLPTSAARALSEGEPKKALLLFEKQIKASRGERKAKLSLGAAVAAYRLRDYLSAQHHYSEALLSTDLDVQQHAHFGIGNASFYRGLELFSTSPESRTALLHWGDSISHFTQVLRIAPADKNAAENLAHVKRRFDEHSAQIPPQTSAQKGKDEKPKSQESKTKENETESPPTDPNQQNKPALPSSPSDKPKPDPQDQTQPDQPESPDNRNQLPPKSKEPIPGETPEEFARRILRDNADFETKIIPRKISQGRRPRKDW